MLIFKDNDLDSDITSFYYQSHLFYPLRVMYKYKKQVLMSGEKTLYNPLDEEYIVSVDSTHIESYYTMITLKSITSNLYTKRVSKTNSIGDNLSDFIGGDFLSDNIGINLDFSVREFSSYLHTLKNDSYFSFILFLAICNKAFVYLEDNKLAISKGFRNSIVLENNTVISDSFVVNIGKEIKSIRVVSIEDDAKKGKSIKKIESLLDDNIQLIDNFYNLITEDNIKSYQTFINFFNLFCKVTLNIINWDIHVGSKVTYQEKDFFVFSVVKKAVGSGGEMTEVEMIPIEVVNNFLNNAYESFDVDIFTKKS